jgi:hypothetical protein
VVCVYSFYKIFQACILVLCSVTRVVRDYRIWIFGVPKNVEFKGFVSSKNFKAQKVYFLVFLYFYCVLYILMYLVGFI